MAFCLGNACIVAGLIWGNVFPRLFATLASLEYASVNMVAILIWAMVYPMMVNVDFSSIRHIGERPKGLVITLVVNWLIKFFTMAALGVLFFEIVFADLIAPEDAAQYIGGLILLGAAPCTAMVFVWSQLTRGDATYTLVQVSVNDVIMIFAFAPIAHFCWVSPISRCHGERPSVVGRPLRRHPLAAGYVTRHQLISNAARNENGDAAVEHFVGRIKPHSVIDCWQLWFLLLIPGRRDHCSTVADHRDRSTSTNSVLWNFLNSLWGRLGLASTLQRCCAVRPNRNIELLNLPSRSPSAYLALIRVLPRNGGRSTGRSTRHALAGRVREPTRRHFPKA